jgi:hypothetical protein
VRHLAQAPQLAEETDGFRRNFTRFFLKLLDSQDLDAVDHGGGNAPDLARFAHGGIGQQAARRERERLQGRVDEAQRRGGVVEADAVGQLLGDRTLFRGQRGEVDQPL